MKSEIDPSSRATNPLEVWLVEDHRAYGDRLKRAINRMDGICCPRCFTASEEALAAFGPGIHPRVLLLDIGLPGMSGLDAIGLFHAKSAQMAIVILTVFEDDDKIFSAICGGAAGYLLKTATTEEIAAAIRTAATGGAPINPRIARRVLEMFSREHPARRDYRLSPRERAVLELLVQGKTIKEAASDLGIGYYTADEYIRGIYEKLQVNSRAGAVAKALREKLV